MIRSLGLALGLALLCLLPPGCGDDDPAPARSAGTWSVQRNPMVDNCGLKVRQVVEWTITDGKALVLKTTREELTGEEHDGVATFTFDETFDSGGCSYSGELTVELTLSDDDQRFTGQMSGYLRYSSARKCGFAAIDGPIRCNMEVGVTGERVSSR